MLKSRNAIKILAMLAEHGFLRDLAGDITLCELVIDILGREDNFQRLSGTNQEDVDRNIISFLLQQVPTHAKEVVPIIFRGYQLESYIEKGLVDLLKKTRKSLDGDSSEHEVANDGSTAAPESPTECSSFSSLDTADSIKSVQNFEVEQYHSTSKGSTMQHNKALATNSCAEQPCSSTFFAITNFYEAFGNHEKRLRQHNEETSSEHVSSKRMKHSMNFEADNTAALAAENICLKFCDHEFNVRRNKIFMYSEVICSLREGFEDEEAITIPAIHSLDEDVMAHCLGIALDWCEHEEMPKSLTTQNALHVWVLADFLEMQQLCARLEEELGKRMLQNPHNFYLISSFFQEHPAAYGISNVLATFIASFFVRGKDRNASEWLLRDLVDFVDDHKSTLSKSIANKFENCFSSIKVTC